MDPDVSIILPCRNEAEFIDSCLDSVLKQDLTGISLEVVVADGMSDDGTREKLARWEAGDERIRVVDNPGRIVPTGLNAALEVVRAPIVIRMDAHSIYPPQYVRNCMDALNRSGADNVGGLVITLPRGHHDGALMVQAVSTHPFGVGGARFRTGSPEGPADTVPFGCFRRDLFARVGLFDERLVRHQDYEFNARIRASGGRIWLDPKITLDYYNQGSVAGLLRQAFKAGRWNVFAWHLAPYSFRPRHGIPGAFLLFLVVGILLASVSRFFAISFAAVMALYLLLAIASSVGQAFKLGRPRLALKLPVVFFAYHVWYGAGLMKGALEVALGRTPYKSDALPWPDAPSARLKPSLHGQPTVPLRASEDLGRVR